MLYEWECPISTDYLILQITQKNFPDLFLLKFEPLSGGVANHTFMVSMSNGREYIVRISRKLDNQISYEKNLMRAASNAADLLHKHEIPTPEVLVVDDSMELIDRPYMLSTYIPANALNGIDLPMESKVTCYEEAGRVVSGLHKITGQRFGRLALMTYEEGFSTWGEAVMFEIQEWKKQAFPAKILPRDYYSKIDYVFQSHMPLLNKIEVPHLTHGDLWSGNILAEVDRGICHFKAIIDLDQALWGDPEYDFSGGMMNDSFAKGYGRNLSNYGEDRNSYVRRKLYLLFYSLMKHYKYKCVFSDNANAQKQQHYITRLLHEFL